MPVAKISNGKSYTFGATVRNEQGPAQFQVAIIQVDSRGAPVDGTVASALGTVDATNTGMFGNVYDASSSFVNSSTFIGGNAVINLSPNAVAVRFQMTPLSGGNFDIISSWLFRNNQ